MKVLKNKYHKKLHFEVNNHSIGIDACGTLSVEDEDAKLLLDSPWIELVELPRAEKVEKPICGSCMGTQVKPKLESRKAPVIDELIVRDKPKVVNQYKGRSK
jgi:hypothetical protein